MRRCGPSSDRLLLPLMLATATALGVLVERGPLEAPEGRQNRLLVARLERE